MSTNVSQQAQNAWAYEQYIRDHWDQLTPFQQEEARAYLRAKFQGSPAATSSTTKPNSWTVPVGYVCAGLSILFLPPLFALIALGCGIYNASKGRSGHGVALIVLAVMCGLTGMALGALYWSSM
jgi:hypothetical protein